MEVIQSYFPNLSDTQQIQLNQLRPLYEDWNSKINVISRKDMDSFETRHVLHALAIAKITSFKSGELILDIGTGGGFPGIPLAIVFPEAQFLLIDSIGKKIKVVEAVVEALGLNNVRTQQIRAEELRIPVDYVLSRAVAPAIKLVQYSSKCLKKNTNHIFLKGGDLLEERDAIWEVYPQAKWKEYALSDYFDDEFFATKKVIHLSNIKA